MQTDAQNPHNHNRTEAKNQKRVSKMLYKIIIEQKHYMEPSSHELQFDFQNKL